MKTRTVVDQMCVRVHECGCKVYNVVYEDGTEGYLRTPCHDHTVRPWQGLGEQPLTRMSEVDG